MWTVRRDAQRALSTAGFGNVDTSHRPGFIRLTAQFPVDFLDQLCATLNVSKIFLGHPVYTGCLCPCVFQDVVESCLDQAFGTQQVVQSAERSSLDTAVREHLLSSLRPLAQVLLARYRRFGCRVVGQ